LLRERVNAINSEEIMRSMKQGVTDDLMKLVAIEFSNNSKLRPIS